MIFFKKSKYEQDLDNIEIIFHKIMNKVNNSYEYSLINEDKIKLNETNSMIKYSYNHFIKTKKNILKNKKNVIESFIIFYSLVLSKTNESLNKLIKKYNS